MLELELPRGGAVDSTIQGGLNGFLDRAKNVINNTYDEVNNFISEAKSISQRAFDTEKTDPYAHQKSAYDFGKLIGNPYVAGALRVGGEVGQFVYYSGKDIYSRIKNGEPGQYQPYSLNAEGGIKDSLNDIYNTYLGGRDANLTNSGYPTNDFDPIR